MADIDTDGNGIPDMVEPFLTKILESDRFGNSADGARMRKRIVQISLALIGTLITAIVAVVLVLMCVQYFVKDTLAIRLDSNLTDLLSTVIWAGVFLASTIIGATVFQAAWINTSSQKNLTTMFVNRNAKTPVTQNVLPGGVGHAGDGTVTNIPSEGGMG